MYLMEKAAGLLFAFKGDSYSYGRGVLDRTGTYAAQFGKSALVAANRRHLQSVVDAVTGSLARHGVSLAGGRVFPSARPNAPFEDIYRLQGLLLHHRPDCIVVIGGGSAIDAAKCANTLAALGTHDADINAYFGTGLVSAALAKTGWKLLPLIAVQTAASSASHLTRYAAVTDTLSLQKKIVVDDALVPARTAFDYAITGQQPLDLTIDGTLDGIAHSLEAFYGAAPDKLDRLKEVALTGIELAVGNARRLIDNPADAQARDALCLATDLGGYSIMIQGTSGAHLTSFSLVDVTTHGRACGLMNPYYTVFFAPAIEDRLRMVGEVFRRYGHISADLDRLKGRELGIAVARGMIAFNQSIGFPTRLGDLPGFTEGHIARAIAAAKDPQLESKLRNMPVPITAAQVDEYMGPVLRAAVTGDFGTIRNLA